MARHRAFLAGSLTALSLLAGCNDDASSQGSASGNPISAPTSSLSGGGASGTAAAVGTGVAPVPVAAHVNATPSVAGTVSVVAGARATMTISLTSAGGQSISGLVVSNTVLPSDWSGASGFACSVTSSGNDCVMTLTYAPTVLETGTLDISFVYSDNLSPSPLVTLSIPYAASDSNNIVATPMPIGQITAAQGTGAQSVSINFTTDDGLSATGLTILSGLSSLPAGWNTSTPSFSCAIVSTGSGCQLALNYAPTASGSGVLELTYGYSDHSGGARTGAINVPYSTNVNGNVIATFSPTGQITAIQNTGVQKVTVSFITDDGQAAHNLSLLSPLPTTLPADWSSAASDFTCGTVSTGNTCQLTLTYSPTTSTSGTVQLKYGYTNPSGVFTTGSLNIPYAATTDNNVVATTAPSGEIDVIATDAKANVWVAFTTDDTRIATALQLTTDLASLPAGWSSADSTFSCASVASGTTCQLPLTYSSDNATSGTLTLRYTYQNNAGESEIGSLSVPYRAVAKNVNSGTSSPIPPSNIVANAPVTSSDSTPTESSGAGSSPTITGSNSAVQATTAGSGSNSAPTASSAASPMPQITSADGALYSSVNFGSAPVNGFYYLNNTYGHGNLINGVDYDTRLSTLQNQFPVNSTITWSWPSSTAGCIGCGSFAYGWPEFQYGASYYGNPYNVAGPWPEQIKNLSTLTITYDLSLSGNLNSYDTLLDTFVTATSNSTDGSYVAEVSFFPQSNSVRLIGSFHRFISFGNACVGVEGRQILIYPVTGTACTDPTTHRNITSGTIDLREIFTYLTAQNLITGNEYLRGYGLGPEMQVPASYNSGPYTGSMTVNALSFDWQ